MKTRTCLTKCAMFLLLVFSETSSAQTSFVGHNGTNAVTDWLGWNAGSTIPLNIRTDGAFPINLFTNNIQRMTMVGAGPTAGYIGLGNNFLLPQSRLHLNEPFATAVYAQWTNTSTGTGSFNGLRIGINNAGVAEVRQQQNSPLEFFQGNIERMRIFQGTQGPRVAIGYQNGPITLAGALLHLGSNFTGFGTAGHRTWMDVGTFCFQVSDNMYIGLKDETALFGADAYDAVINWGDNFNCSNPSGSHDNLRFIFTAPSSCVGDPGAGQDGLEIGRMLGNGNFGVGNFYTVPQPKRRLDVYQNLNSPQFRITYQLNNAVNQGIFTDFQTTPNGDLAIRPFNSNLSNPNRFVGIQTLTPGNTLEINSQALNPGGNGSSGLRFSDLRYGISTPVAPQINQGVLSVDANGDVIYITGGGAGLIDYCPSLPSLTGHAGTFLNGFNMYFVGNQSGNTNDNNFAIGIQPCGNTPLGGKLDVLQRSLSIGTGSTGINVLNLDNSGGTFGTEIIGIRSKTVTLATDFHQIAGWFETSPTLGINQPLAIYVPNKGGKVSIGYPTPYGNTTGLLEVNGNIFMNGVLVSTSDQSYKINVNNIDNAMEKIKKLNGVYYNWDTISYPNMNWESQRQVGFIAQNVDSVLPEVVRTDPNNKKLLVYDRIVALLVQGMKEQQAQIDSLLTSSGSRINHSNNQNTELSSDVILYQNYPNPFGDETVINYFLPDNVSTAKMVFYDETGRLVKEEVIENRGNGSVTLKTNNLASGIYSYSLEVNGKSIQTRKMQKIK
jgi:hypothetical protein